MIVLSCRPPTHSQDICKYLLSQKCGMWETVPLEHRNLPANAIFYGIISTLVPGLFLFCLAMSPFTECYNMKIFITKVSLLWKPAGCLTKVLNWLHFQPLGRLQFPTERHVKFCFVFYKVVSVCLYLLNFRDKGLNIAWGLLDWNL